MDYTGARRWRPRQTIDAGKGSGRLLSNHDPRNRRGNGWGWVGSLFGFGSVQQFDFRGLLIAVFGAFILLLVFRLIRGRK